MSRFGNLRIPPLSAAVNVAWQTIRQQVPEKEPNPHPPSERVRFAQVNHTGPEHHELSNMSSTNQWSPTEKSQAEDAFNQGYQTGDAPTKQQSFSSLDMSEDDFVEGKSEVKINEYQAAWNVTNAIQV